MTHTEYVEELSQLTQGSFLVIEDKPREWWAEKLKKGFFSLLEEELTPVRVNHFGRTFHFKAGLDKHKAKSLMGQLFGDVSSEGKKC